MPRKEDGLGAGRVVGLVKVEVKWGSDLTYIYDSDDQLITMVGGWGFERLLYSD